MDKSIVIKSNKNGIVLILDDKIPFSELIIKLTDKFVDAQKFFGKCEMVLSISGRTLSASEVKQIVDIIHKVTEIEIIYVAEESEANNELFLNAINKLNNQLDSAACEIVRGDIQEGKSVYYKKSVLIIGDVKENAEVHTDGSVFIIGSLIGSVYAGELGNVNSVVYASDMCPDTVMIYDNYFKMPKLTEKKEIKGIFSKKTEEISVKKSMLVYIENDDVKYKILN